MLINTTETYSMIYIYIIKPPKIHMVSALKTFLIQFQARQPGHGGRQPVQLQQVLSVMVHKYSFPFSSTCAWHMCGSSLHLLLGPCPAPGPQAGILQKGSLYFPAQFTSQLFYMLFPISVIDRLVEWYSAI